MGKQIINETFSLRIPDTFQPMSGEELAQMNRSGSDQTGDPYQWGARDRENHLIITVLWKKYPAFLTLLADLKSIARKNQQMAGKIYEGHNYRFLGYVSVNAGEAKAEGYRFTYTVEGISQTMEIYLIKDGRTVYNITCGGREENKAADQETFREILSSLEYV